ncbi:MAG TPA: hypothetical protein VFE25_13045 [Opitutaceae bacterium]|jgi:FlaA1/EpsC-like NDP-sugar epimerase|nr:hypothetical protein [Opitutaceae bacterium]
MHFALKRGHSDLPEIDNIRIPRRLQILGGIVVGIIAISCGTAALLIIVSLLWHKKPLLSLFFELSSVSALLTASTIFLVKVSHRLIMGREKSGRYSSSSDLRMISYAFVVLALLVVVLSLQSPFNSVEFIAALLYLWIALCLWKWASQRERQERHGPKGPAA